MHLINWSINSNTQTYNEFAIQTTYHGLTYKGVPRGWRSPPYNNVMFASTLRLMPCLSEFCKFLLIFHRSSRKA